MEIELIKDKKRKELKDDSHAKEEEWAQMIAQMQDS